MVDRLPRPSGNSEGQALLVASRVHHHRTATFAKVLGDTLPKVIPDPCRDSANEDTRSNLEQPPRKVAAKTWRDGDEHQDRHRSLA